MRTPEQKVFADLTYPQLKMFSEHLIPWARNTLIERPGEQANPDSAERQAELLNAVAKLLAANGLYQIPTDPTVHMRREIAKPLHDIAITLDNFRQLRSEILMVTYISSWNNVDPLPRCHIHTDEVLSAEPGTYLVALLKYRYLAADRLTIHHIDFTTDDASAHSYAEQVYANLIQALNNCSQLEASAIFAMLAPLTIYLKRYKPNSSILHVPFGLGLFPQNGTPPDWLHQSLPLLIRVRKYLGLNINFLLQHLKMQILQYLSVEHGILASVEQWFEEINYKRTMRELQDYLSVFLVSMLEHATEFDVAFNTLLEYNWNEAKRVHPQRCSAELNRAWSLWQQVRETPIATADSGDISDLVLLEAAIQTVQTNFNLLLYRLAIPREKRSLLLPELKSETAANAKKSLRKMITPTLIVYPARLLNHQLLMLQLDEPSRQYFYDLILECAQKSLQTHQALEAIHQILTQSGPSTREFEQLKTEIFATLCRLEQEDQRARLRDHFATWPIYQLKIATVLKKASENPTASKHLLANEREIRFYPPESRYLSPSHKCSIAEALNMLAMLVRLGDLQPNNKKAISFYISGLLITLYFHNTLFDAWQIPSVIVELIKTLKKLTAKQRLQIYGIITTICHSHFAKMDFPKQYGQGDSERVLVAKAVVDGMQGVTLTAFDLNQSDHLTAEAFYCYLLKTVSAESPMLIRQLASLTCLIPSDVASYLPEVILMQLPFLPQISLAQLAFYPLINMGLPREDFTIGRRDLYQMHRQKFAELKYGTSFAAPEQIGIEHRVGPSIQEIYQFPDLNWMGFYINKTAEILPELNEASDVDSLNKTQQEQLLRGLLNLYVGSWWNRKPHKSYIQEILEYDYARMLKSLKVNWHLLLDDPELITAIHVFILFSQKNAFAIQTPTVQHLTATVIKYQPWTEHELEDLIVQIHTLFPPLDIDAYRAMDGSCLNRQEQSRCLVHLFENLPLPQQKFLLQCILQEMIKAINAYELSQAVIYLYSFSELYYRNVNGNRYIAMATEILSKNKELRLNSTIKQQEKVIREAMLDVSKFYTNFDKQSPSFNILLEALFNDTLPTADSSPIPEEKAAASPLVNDETQPYQARPDPIRHENNEVTVDEALQIIADADKPIPTLQWDRWFPPNASSPFQRTIYRFAGFLFFYPRPARFNLPITDQADVSQNPSAERAYWLMDRHPASLLYIKQQLEILVQENPIAYCARGPYAEEEKSISAPGLVGFWGDTLRQTQRYKLKEDEDEKILITHQDGSYMDDRTGNDISCAFDARL
jgi:hypothetical protein